MQAVLMGQSGAANRGCEALARTVMGFLQGADITLGSFDPAYEQTAFGSEVSRYVYNGGAKKPSPLWAVSAVSRRVLKKDITLPLVLGRQKEIVRNSNLFVSIGGDIYCYGKPHWLMSLNNTAVSAKIPAILYGASVEPSNICATIRKDLASLTHIVVRESITHEALSGVNKNLTLAPDPAFTLEAKQVELPKGWKSGSMLGINVSPLITRYEKSPGLVLESFRALIKYILNETDLKPVLIPHVVTHYDNDMALLRPLAESFELGQVLLVNPDYRTRELKYIISQCRMLVAARTHASIAAYSTCVPALVLGYSVKARGIAKDLFESEEGLLLPTKELSSPEHLIETFKGFMRREDEIRRHLEKIIPETKERANRAGNILRKYCTGD